MAERLIAAVFKTVEGHTSGGSNPSPSARRANNVPAVRTDCGDSWFKGPGTAEVAACGKAPFPAFFRASPLKGRKKLRFCRVRAVGEAATSGTRRESGIGRPLQRFVVRTEVGKGAFHGLS